MLVLRKKMLFLVSVVCCFAVPFFSGCLTFGQRVSDPGDGFRYTMPVGADEVPPMAVPEREPPEKEKQEVKSELSQYTSSRRSSAEQGGWGFRVQIFSSLQQDEAEREAEEARKKISEDVFVEFDPPYYKVRIGNCKNSQEAEQLLSDVKRAGYPDAWIVRSRIVSE